MSYTGMLAHRCDLYELKESFVKGIPQAVWTKVNEAPLRCFLDLNFIRHGKDPLWTPEAGRAADRSGVLFLTGNAPVKSGQRVKMIFGPNGTFTIEGAVDEAWQPKRKHHIEVGVTEVPSGISKGQG